MFYFATSFFNDPVFPITIFIEAFKGIITKNDLCNDFLPKEIQEEWFMLLNEERYERLQFELIHRH